MKETQNKMHTCVFASPSAENWQPKYYDIKAKRKKHVNFQCVMYLTIVYYGSLIEANSSQHNICNGNYITCKCWQTGWKF